MNMMEMFRYTAFLAFDLWEEEGRILKLGAKMNQLAQEHPEHAKLLKFLTPIFVDMYCPLALRPGARSG
jgi:hypothetical protein